MTSPTLEQILRERIKLPQRLEQAAVGTMLLGGVLAGGAIAGGLMLGGGLSGASSMAGLPVLVTLVVAVTLSALQQERQPGRSPDSVYRDGQKTHQKFHTFDERDTPANQGNARTLFFSTLAGLVAAGAGSATMLSLAAPLALNPASLLLTGGLMFMGSLLVTLVITRPTYPLGTSQVKAMCHKHVLAKMEQHQTLTRNEQAHQVKYRSSLARVLTPSDSVTPEDDFSHEQIAEDAFQAFERAYEAAVRQGPTSDPAAAASLQPGEEGAEAGAGEEDQQGVSKRLPDEDDESEGKGLVHS